MSVPALREHHGTFPTSIAGFIGLTFGASAAGAMYYWQHSIEIAVATFVIVGYTAGLWFHLTANAYQLNEHYRMLKTLPINGVARRIRRLMFDFGFWWSLVFGIVVIGSGAWYGGQRHFRTLAWIEICWAGITILLNYEVTVLEPTTRCRSCGYQLLGLLNPQDTQQVVRCPECGARWSKSDLCLVPIFKDVKGASSLSTGSDQSEDLPSAFGTTKQPQPLAEPGAVMSSRRGQGSGGGAGGREAGTFAAVATGKVA